MSKNTQNPALNQQLVIQKIYVKDVSFESPGSPEVFTKPWKPKIDIEINTQGKRLVENTYEVLLTATVTAKIEDKVSFLAEIKQAGIFELKGFDENGVAAMLGSYCPNVLFPYIREAISDIVSKGGYPQLLLTPVNFDAIYAQKLQQIQRDTEQAETAVKH